MPGDGQDGFDIAAFFDAIDTRRQAEGLSWTGLAAAIWAESAELNAQRGGHPISPATISGMRRRDDTTCQHALFMLRWLGDAPEDFVADPRPGTSGVALPEADQAHRLRWNLRKLHATLDAARTARGATWARTAELLRCSPNQLTGLRTAKFATGMRLAMRITQGLGRPAAEFVYVSTW